MSETDWFDASEVKPVYDGWYECLYENTQQIVMRWYETETDTWYVGELHLVACFGWGGDRWRGLDKPFGQ